MTEGDTGAPELTLGPLLRYVGETEATIWVETERACEVEILATGRGPSRSPGTTTRWW